MACLIAASSFMTRCFWTNKNGGHFRQVSHGPFYSFLRFLAPLYSYPPAPRGCFITPPEVANTGTRFLTGGPGAAPGGVASKNGWVHMRVQRGVISYSPVCPYSVCVLLQNSRWCRKWLARKVARLPRRGAESTPRPKGRRVCEARRHALPACGPDIPRRITNLTPCTSRI